MWGQWGHNSETCYLLIVYPGGLNAVTNKDREKLTVKYCNTVTDTDKNSEGQRDRD